MPKGMKMAEVKKDSGAVTPAKGDQAQPVKKEKLPFSKKKKLIIAIGALLVVIAIVVTVFLTINRKKPTADEVEGEPKGKAEKTEVADIGIIYPLEPFIVNIYDNNESRYLKIKVEFEISEKEVIPELDGRKALIRDTILILLTTKTLNDIKDLKGKTLLREEILAAINKILPPGNVTRVYFTDFVVQ